MTAQGGRGGNCLYPNPAQNEITVEYYNVPEGSKLYIVNAIGITVEVRLLTEANSKLSLNTTAYSNGIYLARIETGSKALLKNKFIILK